MTNDSSKESAIRYHAHPAPGKLAIRPTKPLSNKRDLTHAYSPGVAHACELIMQDPSQTATMTIRSNLVAVITNGKAVLFKKSANINVFDIEVAEKDVDTITSIIASLEPTFGAVNLEDIKAGGGGLKIENVRMVHPDSAIHSERTVSMDPWKQRFAMETPDRTLADAICGG